MPVLLLTRHRGPGAKAILEVLYPKPAEPAGGGKPARLEEGAPDATVGPGARPKPSILQFRLEPCARPDAGEWVYRKESTAA